MARPERHHGAAHRPLWLQRCPSTAPCSSIEGRQWTRGARLFEGIRQAQQPRFVMRRGHEGQAMGTPARAMPAGTLISGSRRRRWQRRPGVRVAGVFDVAGIRPVVAAMRGRTASETPARPGRPAAGIARRRRDSRPGSLRLHARRSRLRARLVQGTPQALQRTGIDGAGRTRRRPGRRGRQQLGHLAARPRCRRQIGIELARPLRSASGANGSHAAP